LEMSFLPKYYIDVLSKLGFTASRQDVAVIDVKEVFYFQGKFTSSNTEAHLRSIEKQLDLTKYSRAIKKRVYSLAVEMIQNMGHHGMVCFNEGDSSFAVVSHSECIHLISQNCVFASDTSKIAESIDALNAMSDADLRKYHVELLCDNDFSSKGGAGLGLVTLARRSDGRIDYFLEERTPEIQVLTLHLKFSLREENAN
jgi:hypothetical protein